MFGALPSWLDMVLDGAQGALSWALASWLFMAVAIIVLARMPRGSLRVRHVVAACTAVTLGCLVAVYALALADSPLIWPYDAIYGSLFGLVIVAIILYGWTKFRGRPRHRLDHRQGA